MLISSPRSAIRSVVEQFVREELSQEDAQIAGAVWSMLSAGGKELRPRINLLSAQAAVAATPPDPVLASYMELIHIATLIHDDVVDNAGLRRGQHSTNSVHGNRFSVLAGDYLFSWVFKKITQDYANPIPTILASMLSEICNGEVKQLRATGNLSLSRAEYLDIIGKKTAELFASCAEVGAVAALQRVTRPGPQLRDHPVVRALRAYGWNFGLAFQIRDDLLDLIASDAELGKPAGSDLRERKVTLPVIAALEAEDETMRVSLYRLFESPPDAAAAGGQVLRTVIERLRTSAAVSQTKRAVDFYAQQARQALAAVSPSRAVAELEALTHSLSEYQVA